MCFSFTPCSWRGLQNGALQVPPREPGFPSLSAMSLISRGNTASRAKEGHLPPGQCTVPRVNTEWKRQWRVVFCPPRAGCAFPTGLPSADGPKRGGDASKSQELLRRGWSDDSRQCGHLPSKGSRRTTQTFSGLPAHRSPLCGSTAGPEPLCCFLISDFCCKGQHKRLLLDSILEHDQSLASPLWSEPCSQWNSRPSLGVVLQ